MNAIYHQCPKCNAIIESRPAMAGFTVACANCGLEVLVPEQSTEVAPIKEKRSESVTRSKPQVAYCFLCQEERQGKTRYLKLLNMTYSSGWWVRRWVNVRCFCCDKCAATLGWRNVELYLTFLLSGLGAVASCLAYFPFANVPRISGLNYYLGLGLLLTALFLPIIGVFGGLYWHRYRLRRLTHREAREKMDEILGTTEWTRLQEKNQSPAGETVIDCR